MLIIPAINCKDWQCVKHKLEIVAKFLPKNRWVQIDVSDGKFTKIKTWDGPKQLQELKIKEKELRKIKVEAHLMVKNPEKEIRKWEKTADRIIIHAEAAAARFKIYDLKFKDKIGLAINPETPAGAIFPYLNKIKFVQLLAVSPGNSGQKFNRRIINKIRFLKKHYPKIKIEIDGGINLQTAKLVKKAGADIIVSGSYIFNNKNLAKNYKKLTSL